MFSKHVTRDISAYCHGELSNEESKQFAEHLISCAKCRTKFDEVKLGIKFAEQLPKLSAPDHLWRDLEPLLARQNEAQPFRSPVWSWQMKAAAAAVLLLLSSWGIWLVYSNRVDEISADKRAWRVRRLDGAPKVGAERISNNGELAVGEWLETDANSRAQIAVGSIGNVEVDENTRVRLLETRPTEHRLELARGKMSAQIWAPPRLFFVNTPSAVAADLGCAYTLEVDDHGASLLRVTSGWVALQLKARESMVPAGAACETRPVLGPGTPYFEDSSASFQESLKKVDFDSGAVTRSAALTVLFEQARPRDTLTLWHLLMRVDGEDRGRVYDKMAALSPPPPGVTREGILGSDQTMVNIWRNELETTWMGVGKGVPKPIKTGLSDRLKELTPK
ncbi:MAG TPA: zf-HC2 domain-containing protein [Pyrinomonadaceae bacterium]|nr:zf-HC2 domain-containing protein [Pyrinomonadaceae bacterium]